MTVLTDVTLQASVGTVTGKATLRGDGSINGDFAAPALDMGRLNYLTGDLVIFKGSYRGVRGVSRDAQPPGRHRASDGPNPDD